MNSIVKKMSSVVCGMAAMTCFALPEGMNANNARSTSSDIVWYTPSTDHNHCFRPGEIILWHSNLDADIAGKTYTISYDLCWEGFTEAKRDNSKFVLRWMNRTATPSNWQAAWGGSMSHLNRPSDATLNEIILGAYSGETNLSYQCTIPQDLLTRYPLEDGGAWEYFGLRSDYSNGKARIGIKNLKFEEGTTATPWIPRLDEWKSGRLESSDPRFAIPLTVTTNGIDVGENPFETLASLTLDDYGTEVVITVGDNDEAIFNGWWKVSAGIETNGNTATFTIGTRDDWLVRYFASPNWTFDAEKGVLTNKIWTLYAFCDANNNITIGNETQNSNLHTAFPADTYNAETGEYPYGSGMLDLSGKVYKSDGITPCTITAFRGNAFGQSGGNTDGWVPTIGALIFPKETTSFGNQLMNLNGAGNLNGAILCSNIYADCKGATSMPTFAFSGRGGECYLNLPNVKTWGGYVFNGYTVKNTENVSAWNFDSLTTISGNGFYNCKGTGTLSYPKVTSIGTKGFHNCGVSGGLVLGTGYKIGEGKTLSIGEQAFDVLNGVTNIVFGPYASITSATNSFRSNSKLTGITFQGRPMGTNLLNHIINPNVKHVTNEMFIIRGSRALNWGEIDGAQADYSAYEDYAPLGLDVQPNGRGDILAVFLTADGEAKAWIVDEPSEYDPKGTVFLLR